MFIKQKEGYEFINTNSRAWLDNFNTEICNELKYFLEFMDYCVLNSM
jgi:hypothetical protein